ncbi:MAG TPA: c-type cytochrome [Puia sp.]|nr:c-type cytochrome [Puia sp.]
MLLRLLLQAIFIVILPAAVQQNHPPQVIIKSPADNSEFTPAERVHYIVSVSDREDGESRFGEINKKEVLMQIANITMAGQEKRKAGDHGIDKGLIDMMRSNCLSCHSFDRQSTGPSFRQIFEQYKAQRSVLSRLEKRIQSGSRGVWGNQPMPSHPELSDDEIRKMAEWILFRAGKGEMQYYVGTEGFISFDSIRLKGSRNVYILSASYTDHGINGKNRLTGEYSVTISDSIGK